MSHFTTIKTEIKDLSALRSVCAEMGLVLLQNAAARGYGQTEMRAPYVIRLKGPYDIALNRRANGTYELITDWWAGHVAKEVGPGFGRLLQLYGVHKATLEARKRGYRLRRENQPNGEIKLILQAP